MFELRGVTLEVAPPVSFDLDGKPLNEAINDIRDQIKVLQQQLQATRLAPLPLADRKDLAAEFIAKLLHTARPKLGIVHGALTVTWHDDIIASRTDVLSMIAWNDPGRLLLTLEREIDREPEPANGMSADLKQRKVADLESQLDKLERSEQAMIEHAAGDGVDMPQRLDVSPAAFLGVVVTRAQQQQVA